MDPTMYICKYGSFFELLNVWWSIDKVPLDVL
jgi:hypothetical protein